MAEVSLTAMLGNLQYLLSILGYTVASQTVMLGILLAVNSCLYSSFPDCHVRKRFELMGIDSQWAILGLFFNS